MKKLLSIYIILLLLLTGVSPVYAFNDSLHAENIKIYVNGKIVKVEKLPLWNQYRLLVPAKTVFSMLGARVDWKAENGQILIQRGNTKLTMKIGEKKLSVNQTVSCKMK